MKFSVLLKRLTELVYASYFSVFLLPPFGQAGSKSQVHLLILLTSGMDKASTGSTAKKNSGFPLTVPVVSIGFQKSTKKQRNLYLKVSRVSAAACHLEFPRNRTWVAKFPCFSVFIIGFLISRKAENNQKTSIYSSLLLGNTIPSYLFPWGCLS